MSPNLKLVAFSTSQTFAGQRARSAKLPRIDVTGPKLSFGGRFTAAARHHLTGRSCMVQDLSCSNDRSADIAAVQPNIKWAKTRNIVEPSDLSARFSDQ